MQWIISNILWLKDVLWIVFTLVATVIAFLTYRRARYSLLQPLRSEVVKRQTELLMELLQYIAGGKGEIYCKIDYMGILSCNAYKLLELANFRFSNNDDSIIKESIKNNIGGQILLKSTGFPRTFCAPTDPFEKNNNNDSFEKYKKDVISDIEKGKGLRQLECIYLTKQHILTISDIEKYKDNPLMPKEIQLKLKQFLSDISQNINGPILVELECFIEKAIRIDSDKDNPISITPQAMYNSFSRHSKSHSETIKELTEIIRAYLQVDAKWS